jgi:pimeloyl-ACP methyl ester carboxylesterase
MTFSKSLRAAACLLALFFSGTTLAAATALPALPAAAESFDSGSLHVDRYGDGPQTIVFVPGLGSGTWSWAEQIARFSKTYRVYAITLDGFDGRPFVAQSDLFGTFAKDFWTLLDARHIARPVVIGHSLGGTLAIALAEQHPEKLAGVIALDGLPVFPTVAQQTDAQRVATAAAASAPIATLTKAQMLAYNVRYMQSIGVLDPTLVEPAAALESRSEPTAVSAWLQADLATDLRPALPHATLPMLELMPYAPGGPYSKADTVAFYTMLLAGAPQITVTPIDGAKHFAMLDAPGAVDAAIARFLAAHAPGPIPHV